jgi:hypothetical protein
VELAVVVVHGLGSQEPGYSEGLQRRVLARLAATGIDSAGLAWEEICWADVVERRQRDYLERADAAGALRWDWLRTQVVRGLGDAAAYQRVGGATSTYVRIHDRIRDHVRALYADKLRSEPVPLVVLAHSLGSHMMSCYIWDTQKGLDTGADPHAPPFERMEWLAGMITFGSTIPLFTFAHDPVKPIAFPGGALPPRQRERAQWLNFFDADDVLGYPLKPIGAEYDKAVSVDVEINVGGVLHALGPASHNEYWKDGDFVRPVADYLADLLSGTSAGSRASGGAPR